MKIISVNPIINKNIYTKFLENAYTVRKELNYNMNIVLYKHFDIAKYLYTIKEMYSEE